MFHVAQRTTFRGQQLLLMPAWAGIEQATWEQKVPAASALFPEPSSLHVGVIMSKYHQ